MSGQWSSVSKSGGFLVLKANGVTLSFYPKTKTLNVQGAKQEEVRKKLFSLLSRGNLNIDANEQVLNEQHVGQEQTDDEDVDVLPNGGDNEMIRQNHDEPAYHEEQAFHHYPGCKENADAINGLKQEFVKLNEQLKTRVFTPSYDELLLRIKTENSLVTALRILSEDVKDMGVTQIQSTEMTNNKPPNLGKQCSQRRRKILLGTKVSPLVTISQARVNRIKTNLQMWLSSVIPSPKTSLVRNCQETKMLMLFLFLGPPLMTWLILQNRLSSGNRRKSSYMSGPTI